MSSNPRPTGESRERVRAFWIAALLVVATVVVYAQVGGHEFTIDVGEYVGDNPHVRDGLTLDGITWALTGFHANNWHPVTWWSHMADVAVFGLEPRGHHLVNVALHALNAVLLFLVLRRMTAALWPSALVAALFALHPLHVESVAWVLERKDVLSTLFWILTLGCHARYAKNPSPRRYAATVVVFALGLMTKPMLVTLPLVLLLVDYWPLRRFERESLRRLVVEKLPLLLLAVVVSVITIRAQGDAVATLAAQPLALRIQNAIVSYAVYAGQMIWPAGLAFYYPFPPKFPVWGLLSAVGFVASISIVAVRLRDRFPFLATGWGWYLVTLLPVIGLVQVGAQARADRYTYIPLIGLFIVVAWGASALAVAFPRSRLWIAGGLSAAIIALAATTWVQVGYWKDTITLLTRSAAVTHDNYFAHYNLANHFKRAGDLEAAVGHYEEALRIRPELLDARYNLGNTFAAQGRLAEAKRHHTIVLETDPTRTEYHFALANTESALGNIEQAIEHLRAGLRIERDPELLNALGSALLRQGDIEQAIALLSEAVSARPDARRHNNLGVALMSAGRTDEAVAQFEEALRLDPRHEGARRNLAAAAGR